MVYRDLVVYSSSINIASVASQTTVEQTFTVNGLVAATDVILSVSKPTCSAGLAIGNARVSGDNTLALTLVNCSAGAVDPAAETYLIVAGRVGGSSIANGNRL